MRVYRRSKGDILQPSRFTPGVVRGLKQKSREWSGQYQQEPHPASGIIFQPSWWKFFKSRDLPEFDIVALSVDCAFKSAAQNDFVCLQKWGAVGPRSYLLEMVTMHLGYAATKAMIKALQQDGLRASVILVEDKANGSAIIEELRGDDFGASVIAINPEGGKESRAYAASADCEAGNVYLPENADWLAPFLRTAAAFPAVRHDDEIDALTQFLNWRRARNESLGFIDWIKRKAQGIAGGILHPDGTPKQIPNGHGAAIAKPGKDQRRVEGYLAKRGDPSPCPLCHGPRIWLSGGVPGILVSHCNQDGSDDGVLPGPTEIPGHIHIWRPIPGGQEKCDDCQEQRWISGTPPAVNGMSRGQYAARQSVFGRNSFGRFG